MFASFHRGQIFGDAAMGIPTFPIEGQQDTARIADIVVTLSAPRPIAIALRIYQHHSITVLACVGGALKFSPSSSGWQSGLDGHRIGHPGGIPVIQ